MDFHGLTRRELQALCKKNRIPANQTNVAMADALHALSDVEGIEELSQLEGFQTPAPCRMSQRTSRKKSELPPDAVVIELEDSAAPVSRATRRGTVARASASRRRVTSEEEGETTEVVALEALQSPLPTRTAGTSRATTGKSTRRANEAQQDVVKPVGTESNLNMSVRRSARLKSVVDQAVQVLPSAVTKSRRKKMAVKIGAMNEEPEESTENIAELLVDAVETADFTNVKGTLESEDKAGLFPASNDLTIEATEEMTRSKESKSEVVDEKELTGDFKSEPLRLAEVMSPTKESKLDGVDATNTALVEKETESVDVSVRRSALIMSVNKAVDEFLIVTKSRSKKMDVKIGALTAEPEDFTYTMPGNMSARRSARIKSVNKAGEEGPSVTKSRSKKMAVKIGALTTEEDFTDNMPGEMVDTAHTANYTNMEVPFVSVDKAGFYSGSKDLQNAGGEDESNAAVEAEEEVVVLSEESKSEVADEEEETDDFKREPLPWSEVMMPSSEEIKNDVDNTNIALLEEETKTVNQDSHFLGEVVALGEESKSEVADDEEETNDFKREPLPWSEVMMPSSEEIKNDVDNTNIALLEEETKTVNQDSHFLGEVVALGEESKSEVADEEEETNDFKREPLPLSEVMMPSSEEINNDANNTNISLLEEETKTVSQESHFLGDMDEEDNHTQLPLEDGEEIRSDIVGNTNIALLEEEAESVNQESFLGDMDEEDNPMQLPKASNVLEDGEKAVNKDFMGSIGNFSINDSATSVRTVSLLNEMELTGQEELKFLSPTFTDTKIEEYEQIAGLAADVNVKDTNLFVGDIPVEAVDEELAVNINNIEWSFFMGGCGDSALISPDATPSVLTAKEHDILASNRVSESPFLLNILYEEESSEKESERILIEGTGKTPEKENLNANSVSKIPTLFDTAETEAMLVVGTLKTPNLFNTVTEEMLLDVTEKKTLKKTGATPGKSNGKKKTQEDADKENNGAQSLKREGVKRPLQLVKEKSSMYQDLSLRQLKDLYKEKASGVKKAPALQPLNQNCLLGDGNI